MANFFISYNRANSDWAEWVAWHLESEGYKTLLQAWDFAPGSNFVLEMQRASTNSETTIVLLSDEYFDSEFTQSEWATAFAKDPLGEKRALVPIKVDQCDPQGLLGPIVYIDLTGVTATEARSRLLVGLSSKRKKPNHEPQFPGYEDQLRAISPPFPGSNESGSAADNERTFRIGLDLQIPH